MAYRSGTYVAFHANNKKEPHESDRKYLELLKAWNVRSDDDFKFVDRPRQRGCGTGLQQACDPRTIPQNAVAQFQAPALGYREYHQRRHRLGAVRDSLRRGRMRDPDHRRISRQGINSGREPGIEFVARSFEDSDQRRTRPRHTHTVQEIPYSRRDRSVRSDEVSERRRQRTLYRSGISELEPALTNFLSALRADSGAPESLREFG